MHPNPQLKTMAYHHPQTLTLHHITWNDIPKEPHANHPKTKGPISCPMFHIYSLHQLPLPQLPRFSVFHVLWTNLLLYFWFIIMSTDPIPDPISPASSAQIGIQSSQTLLLLLLLINGFMKLIIYFFNKWKITISLDEKLPFKE